MMINTKHICAVVTLCLALLGAVIDAYPRFHLGRPRGGRLGAPRALPGLKTPPAQWFTQILDHFDGQNNGTWKQRYFVNDQFYKTGGPIFIMIGGEGTANPVWMTQGAWIDYGKEFGAVCLQLEHRYYGQSHPTPDMSLGNLRHLSSFQALADLANFVDSAKSKYGRASKVITFGGSYPGSLSAWFRLKYPQLSDGAVATSGPLLAQVDFQEYLGVVNRSLAAMSGGPQCNNNIRAATAKVGQLLQTSAGRQQLVKTFNLCGDADSLTDKNNVMNLYSVLAGNFEGVVQYNRDNRAFEGAKATNVTIETLCRIMTSDSTSPLDRYAAVNGLLLRAYNETCQDVSYAAMVADLRQEAWASAAAEGGRQWTYQTCAEFGFFQSTDLGPDNQPFGSGFPVEFFLQQCADIFSPAVFPPGRVKELVRQTNLRYGGLAPRLTKVVLPNGSVDPWHALGATSDLGPDARAIFINGTAHCANMYPAAPTDPIQLRAARLEVRNTIASWLQ